MEKIIFEVDWGETKYDPKPLAYFADFPPLDDENLADYLARVTPLLIKQAIA